VGTSFFLPMFAGGLAAGVVADRFDRRRTVVNQLAVLVPVAAAMATVVLTDRVEVWMVYVFALAVGVGQVVDMTNRRALVHDVVGDRLMPNAMALESMSMATGNMLGALTGGVVIGLLGIGQAYGLVAVLYVVCLVLMGRVPAIARRTARATGTGTGTGTVSVREDLRDGLRALPANKPLVSLLGVTVLMNFLFFSYMPLVPVVARRFDVGPLLTGLLASGTGMGLLLGSAIMVLTDPQRRGRLYVLSSFAGMACLIVFALMSVYPIALVMLVVTGMASAGFASVQTALVMEVASVDMRGRAMGLLSMAIGALPFGMLLLGAVAEEVGTSTAVIVSADTGIVAMALWVTLRPEVLRIP
jgi:MFS family permease